MWYVVFIPRPFSPPVFDRLQYTNMEGEGLEYMVTWSYKESRALSHTINPSAGGQSISKVASDSILVIVHISRDHSTQNNNYYCWAPPPVCLPSVYLMSVLECSLEQAQINCGAIVLYLLLAWIGEVWNYAKTFNFLLHSCRMQQYW